MLNVHCPSTSYTALTFRSVGTLYIASHIWSHVWGCQVYLSGAMLASSPGIHLTLDSSQTPTCFDGFMNHAGVAHHAAQLAQANDDLIGFVVAHSVYQHCIDMAASFDILNNYSPSINQ